MTPVTANTVAIGTVNHRMSLIGNKVTSCYYAEKAISQGCNTCMSVITEEKEGESEREKECVLVFDTYWVLKYLSCLLTVGVPDKFWGLSRSFHSALSMVMSPLRGGTDDVTGLECNHATVSIMTSPGPATKSKINKENNNEEGGKRGRSWGGVIYKLYISLQLWS